MPIEQSTEFKVSDGEELTDQERAYMRGEEIAPAPAPNPAPAPEVAPQQRQSAPDGDDELEIETSENGEEVVIRDKDGRLRDAKTNKYVSHKALHKEREEHKKTKARLAEESAARRAIYELAGLPPDGPAPRAVSPAPAAQPAEKNPFDEPNINFMQEPIKAFEQQQRRNAWLVKQLAERDKKIEGVNSRIDQTHEGQAMRTWVETDVKTFVREQPAFTMAWNHLVESLRKEYILSGVPEDQVEQQLNEAQAEFAKNARKNNKSFAKLVWEFAEVRGFKAPAIEKGPDGKPVIRPSVAPGTQQAQQKIEQIKRGQSVATSMSGVGGSSGNALTSEQIAAMSEEEYLSHRAKLKASGSLGKILGA